MGISVECASRAFISMWLSLYLLLVASIVAVASPGQWCGADGLFTSLDPSTGLTVGRALVLLGLTFVTLSLITELACVICIDDDFVKCFRASTFIGALVGFLGSLLSVTNMPEHDLAKMGAMAITAIASFVLTGILTVLLAAFCHDCCPKPASYLRGDAYTDQDRAAMTRIHIRGVGYWLRDKGSQALSPFRRQGNYNPNIEMQEAALNLNGPVGNFVGHGGVGQGALPGYQPVAPNPGQV